MEEEKENMDEYKKEMNEKVEKVKKIMADNGLSYNEKVGMTLGFVIAFCIDKVKNKV